MIRSNPESAYQILLSLTKASSAVSATLEEILAQALQELAAVNDLIELDKVRVHYLGKKGLFTLQMKELGNIDPEQDINNSL